MASFETPQNPAELSDRDLAIQLADGSLGDLLRAEIEWSKSDRAGDQKWKNFFDAARVEKLNRYAQQWDDEAVGENEVLSDFARGIETGEYDLSMKPIVQAVVLEKAKRTEARGTGILSTAYSAVTSLPQVAKELGVSGLEIGKTLGETAAGYAAMGYGGLTGDEYLAEEGRQMGTKAGARTAIGVEGETKETLGFYRRSLPRAYDFIKSLATGGTAPSNYGNLAMSLAGYGDAGIVARQRTAGIAGDQEAFKTYFDTRLEEELDIQRARLGRGELTKAIGADVDSLKRIGVELTQEDLDRATAMAPLLDATEILEAASGVGLVSATTRKLAATALKKAGMKAASDVLLTAAERGVPSQRVLSRTLKTAERIAEEARSYDTLFRKTRLAAGEKTVRLGQAIKKAAVPAGSPLLVAGGVLAGGGDAQDAITGAILAGAGRYALGSRFGIRALGTGLEKTGELLSKKFAPTSPWEAIRRSMIDFRRDLQLGMAGGLTASAATFFDPALTPEARGTLASSGILMGGVGVTGARMMDSINYGLNFAPRLSTPDSINGEAVLPRGYADVGADRANGQAFKKLSEDSTIFLRSLQDYLGNDGVVMVATTPEEYAKLANSRVKDGAVDVAGSAGVTFNPEDTISGKAEVVLDLSGGINNAAGHEVTHAIMNVIEAGGGPLAEKLQAAKFAVINDFGGVDSDGFKAVKADYEKKLGREISNDAVVDEWLAEHGSVLLAGIPLGKLPGVNKGVVSNLYDAFLAFSETMRGRVEPYSETAGAPVTSSVLQYTPSVSMLNMLENIFAAYKYEKENIIPESKPAKSAEEVADAKRRQDAAVVDVGVATPVPAELTVVTDVPVEGSISGIPAGKPAAPKKPKAPTPAPVAEAPAPVAETPAPQRPNVRVTRGQQEGFIPPTPEQQAANAQRLQELADRPRAQQAYVETEYFAAEPVTGTEPDAPRRLAQRQLADKAEAEYPGYNNPLRAPFQKIFAPYKNLGGNKIIGFSFDKLIQNLDILAGWVGEQITAGKDVQLPYDLSSPELRRDVQTYLQNHANGYAGDGRRLQRPADTVPGTIPDENPNYTPVPLEPVKAQFINLLMGLEPPKKTTVPAAFNRRFAEQNGLAVTETPTGSPEVNVLRAQLRDLGFDSSLLNGVLEVLRTDRIVGEIKERPDINLGVGEGAFIRAGFMPAEAAKTSPGNPQAQESKKRTASMAVRSVAEDYMREAGLPYTPHEGYSPVNEDLAKRLADFYEQSESAPDSPEVQSAYRSLADETMAQYRAMEAAGIQIEPWEGKGEPYANSAEMLKDVRDNKHLWFFTTESGFGKGETVPNALLEDSGVVINGKPLVINDVFRAVHDYFGHAKEGYEFGPRGEFNAYLAHSRMFSDAAKPALASETLAQNSWVNFGPHLRREDGSLPKSGEEGFVSIKDRPFADQKNLVIPDELLTEADQVAGQFMPGDKPSIDRIAQETDTYVVVPRGDRDPLNAGFREGKFYVSPDGRWISVEEHELAAADILKQMGERIKRGRSDNPAQELLEGIDANNRGMEFARVVDEGDTLYVTKQNLTPSQLRELKNVAIEYGRTLIQDLGARERILFEPEGPAGQFMPAKRDVKPLETESIGRNIDFTTIPTDEEITDALSSDKKPFVGRHRDLEPGTPVGLRIDIPAFMRTGKYVVTVHEKAAGGRVGLRIGYDGIAAVDNPTFFSNEAGAERIRGGKNKFPVATVEGEFNPTREIPADIEEWTPVGYDPREHSYFYEKGSMRPVLSGSEAISVGNTVFVKDPVFGNPNDFRYMPAERDGKPIESEGLRVGGMIEDDAAAVFGEDTLPEQATEADAQFMPAPPVESYDPTNPDIRYMPKESLTTQFESKKKRGSMSGVQHLVHFSSRKMKTLDPKKSSGKGAATPTDLQGLKRGYFYRIKKGAYESGIAERAYIYVADVDGNSIYDLTKDPLGYRNIPDREAADQMLVDAGFAGMRGNPGSMDMVAMFKPVKVTEAVAEDVYTKKQIAAQRAEQRRRGALEDEEIDYQKEYDDWEKERERRWSSRRFMPGVAQGPTRKLTREVAGQFMPAAPEVDFNDFIGRDVVTLTTDRLDVGEKEVGPKESRRTVARKAQGGRGFPLVYTGMGWAFSTKDSAARFLTRLKISAEADTALVATSVLDEKNVLNSPFGQLAVATAYRAAVDGGFIKERDANTTIREVFSRAAQSTKNPDIEKIRSLADYEKAVANWPFGFGETRQIALRLDAAKLKIPAEIRQALGLDTLSIARDISDPALRGIPNFAFVSVMEIPLDQTPVKDNIHISYPYSVKGKLLGFLKNPFLAEKLVDSQKVRTREGRLTAQPMMTVMPSIDALKPSEINPNPEERLESARIPYAPPLSGENVVK